MTLTTKQIIRPFWILAAALMVADATTTYIAFTAPGYVAVEGNPVMVAMFDQVGVGATMALKALIGVLACWFLAVRIERGRFFEPRLFKKVSNNAVRLVALYSLTFTLLLMGLVVGNNLRALLLPS